MLSLVLAFIWATGQYYKHKLGPGSDVSKASKASAGIDTNYHKISSNFDPKSFRTTQIKLKMDIYMFIVIPIDNSACYEPDI